jgi:hypothetical protein
MRTRRFPLPVALVLAAALCAAPARARTDSTCESGPDTGRLLLVGGGMLGIMGGIHVYQQNGWWKDNRAPFHVREDPTYALGVDKVGHFYAGNLLSVLLGRAFRWTGYRHETSLLLGAGTATLFQTFIEVEDGFSTWGFDRVDFAANIAGAWYPLAQEHVPLLRNVNLKFSYLPSPNIHEPGAFPGQKRLLMDDYEGQTFWLSLTVERLLPESARPWWPDFLALAVGYGARDILSPDKVPVWLLALDYDMAAVIPRTTPFLRTLGDALNFVHFPAPAVRISPGTIWYGLYF